LNQKKKDSCQWIIGELVAILQNLVAIGSEALEKLESGRH
jgi:hypothetical protein